MGDDVYVHYDKKKRETEAAILFVIDGEEIWLPKSQIEYDSQDKVVIVPEWLARKHDLDDSYLKERQMRLPFGR